MKIDSTVSEERIIRFSDFKDYCRLERAVNSADDDGMVLVELEWKVRDGFPSGRAKFVRVIPTRLSAAGSP